MIQRREIPDNIGTINSLTSRPGSVNVKVTIKEKKAAKRKEKSRVAAQIRRNKESQTLILLQNALPLALPSPSQMLEKSIVIRIAGQTLFLMNTLDQVLGMNGWLTIPLISNNFLTFFMDVTGQIVYVSPNIQVLMEQYHWSNIIGMSIYDVVNFKSRWPITGEVVRLRLPTNPNLCSEHESYPSWSSSIPQPNGSRAAIASKLNIRKNSSKGNSNSSTCSLYNVWCCTNISHTDSKLKLLILQAVRIDVTVLNDISRTNETLSKPFTLSKNATVSLQRSISWPSMSINTKLESQNPSNSVKNQTDADDFTQDKHNSIYHRLVASAHDRYFNFKSSSIEFCQLIGESPESLKSMNYLDIIHLEDIVGIKSFLDHVYESNCTRAWTPIYRIISRKGHQCTVKTLVKQYLANLPYSLVLSHLVIERSHCSQELLVDQLHEQNINIVDLETPMSNQSTIDVIQKPSKTELYIIRPDTENLALKRKLEDRKKIVSGEKYLKIIDRTMSAPVPGSDKCVHTNLISSVNLRPTICDNDQTSEILNNDPFLPMGFERDSILTRPSNHQIMTPSKVSRSKTVIANKSRGKHRSNLGHLCNPHNRSPSYSLESCVLTSPGSESTDINIEDQFFWDSAENFEEINQLHCWLDEQFHQELE